MLHCVLANDHHGALIKDAVLARNITLVIDPDTSTPSPHHVNIMDSAGQRVSILLENGSSDPVVDVDRLAPLIAEADIIFASITASTRPVLELLDQSSALVQVDLHDWDGENPYHAPFAAVGDIIQVSDEGLSNPVQTCEQLLKSGAREVVVTKGARGACVFAGDTMTEIAPEPVEAVDTNGAGDAFGVAYTLARHRGLSIAEAGAQAAHIAALVVASADIVPTELS